MLLEIKRPEDFLNKAYASQVVTTENIECFSDNLAALLEYLQDGEREEHQKNHIRDFLNTGWYQKTNLVNTAGDIDLAIYSGMVSSSPVSVIIETKSTTNITEMMTCQKPNAKALHEIILYYLREVFDKENYSIKHLIITNTNEWFVFDGVWFEKNIRRNKSLEKGYKAFKRDGLDNRYFYESIAKKWLDELEEPIPCCWFDLREYHALVQKPDLTEKDRKKLITLYKFLSPQHLLKLPIANDSNSLNNEFYSELLHIVGLEEVKEKGKKLIRRKASERRNEGSLLENTINLLKVQQALEGINNLQEYGSNEEDQYFSVALELCITWLNRILFLKLLEGRLIAWHQGDTRLIFLNKERIKDFDDLQELFFEVLARQENERTSDIQDKFGNIPYLNSSLFEISYLERCALQISSLKHRLTIPLFPATVLKNEAGKRRSGADNTLYYLFDFLDSYDFASEGKALVKDAPKTIINASVLGLIFEKINGYRDGSFYTPGYITMYMSREAIRRAVVERFRASSHLPGMKKLKDFDDLKDRLDASDREVRKKAGDIINSLKICDPAVGSGHFLVSALNELIVIKYELGILSYRNNGDRIKGYRIAVENDELVITSTEDDQLFSYRLNKNERPIEELHRLQETLFHEKELLIENCLFGVDINPKSVAICRLRLWIELLKNAYYRDEGRLETLPNIDINIKCGNSLVSRFSLNDDSTGLAQYAPPERKRLKELTRRYKEKVWDYKQRPSNKGIIRKEIESLKEQWRTFSLPSDFYMKSLHNIKNQLAQAVFAFDEVGHQQREKLHQQAAELEEKIAARQQTVYANAFEWRFEFPEVLDEEGNFTGFDVVIGNPPYGVKFSKLELSECLARYSTAERVPDSYCFFMLLAFEILCNDGIQSLIVPNTFCDLENGEEFRKVLLKKYDIQWIWQTGWAFDSAVVDTLVFQAVNRAANIDSRIRILLDEQIYFRKNSEFISNRLSKIDYRNQPGKIDLIQKINDHSVMLRQLVDVKAGVKMYEKGKGKPPQTDDVVSSRPFSTVGKSPSGWKPLYRGGDVTRYSLNMPNEYVHYGPWLAAPRTVELFEAPKLLMRRTDDRLMCALDETSAVCVNSCHVIKYKPETEPQFPYKFLMAILNSQLLQYYFELTNPQMKGKVFAEIKVVYVENLPIPNVFSENQKSIVDLVDQILTAKKADPKSDTSNLEKQIDQLVYQLYNLTPEEIALVEGNI